MFSLFVSYLGWHYGKGLADLKSLFQNFVHFFYHFFSIPILLHTLFVPWHRLSEEYRGGFNIGAALASLLINTLMRFVGALIRLVLIIFGLGCILSTLVLGIGAFVVWLALPFLIIGFLLNGVLVLFN